MNREFVYQECNNCEGELTFKDSDGIHIECVYCGHSQRINPPKEGKEE